MRLVNGLPADSLPLADRAIQFGDGVFRTIKLVDGGLAFWKRHYTKLCADCVALGIVPPEETDVLADIRTLLNRSGWRSATVKLIVTRGESARGYAIPPDIHPNRIAQIAPLPAYPSSLYRDGARVRLCNVRAGWQPALAGVKHLNRLENVLARQEWSDPAIQEGLLLDRDGHVLEGVMSNVLVKLDGQLVTPLLDGGGVAGVMREVALEAARRLGWPVAERALTLDELLRAERVWLSNSLIGLVPVSVLDAQRWNIDTHCALHHEMIHFENNEMTWLL
ncbi:4-amino-4-deoxychorismate lyase [Formivibrio citricus]|uniref:aminodeoxychorismate lyase n=1 Tax=Formivibrio citricus TaxID=83765 RepID=A0A1I4YP96_9NEIS|nr:aminodeoxychorismate lyase [Formivibrio citricus]SFN39855.1 4-amino-4-deoxychorismate lyase [Formivibrio citricus]